MKRTLAALAALPLLLTACGSGGDSEPEAEATPDATQEAPAPEAKPDNCLNVSMKAMKAIASDDWTPVQGAALVGPDFSEKVYLVAIEFDDGSGAGTEVGVWATPDLKNPGPIMSVDGMAASFSNWPQGTAAEPLDATVAGVDEVKDCLA